MRLSFLLIAVATVGAIIRVQAGDYALYAKRPEYPIEARRQHLGGRGAFALHVRSDGSVERVETLKSIGHPLLDHAAIAAFRQWRFRPHTVSIVRVPIRYVDGPVRIDREMTRPPSPGYGDLITVFSRSK
jgi:TonB family protein